MELSRDFYTITKQLEIMPKNWQISKWLKNELLLLLDEKAKAELLVDKKTGHYKTVHYDKKYGLILCNPQNEDKK